MRRCTLAALYCTYILVNSGREILNDYRIMSSSTVTRLDVGHQDQRRPMVIELCGLLSGHEAWNFVAQGRPFVDPEIPA
jgi:hypothetical protein